MKFNTLTFINEIKKRPALWDSKNSKYTCEERNQSWKEIFKIYETVENVPYSNQTELHQILQKRWKNLRDNYVKFYKRMQANPSGRVKYVFGKRLNFLDKAISTKGQKKKTGKEDDDEEEEVQNTLKTRTRTPKITIKMDSRKSDDDDDDDDDDSTEDDDNIVGPEEIDLDRVHRGDTIDLLMDTTKSIADESPHPKKTNSQYEDVEFLSDLEPHAKDKDPKQTRDECTVYGELVGVKLRKLNSRTRAYVQHLINNTLFEAEMGKYNNVNSP